MTKRVYFSDYIFTEWITTGNVIKNVTTIEGLPVDSKFVSGGYNPEKRAFYAEYSHPSFEDDAPIMVILQRGR